MFPSEIEAAYRVVETRYGNGESERTIPLGSWRKGGGLAGTRGHVYIHGPETAGVWFIRRTWPEFIATLRPEFPNLTMMQEAEGECTFSVPMSDLDRLLPLLKAKRRTVVSEALRNAAKQASKASPIIPKAKTDTVLGV